MTTTTTDLRDPQNDLSHSCEMVRVHYCQARPHLAIVLVKLGSTHYTTGQPKYVAWTYNRQNGGFSSGKYGTFEDALAGFHDKVKLYEN